MILILAVKHGRAVACLNLVKEMKSKIAVIVHSHVCILKELGMCFAIIGFM